MLLAELLKFLAGGSAFWYTINGDTSLPLSLRNRLGFVSDTDYFAFLVSAGLADYFDEEDATGNNIRSLRILGSEWKDFLQNEECYGLSRDVAEHTRKRFCMEDAMAGTKQVGPRFNYHVICIGMQNLTTFSSITSQKARGRKQLLLRPPTI